MGSLKWMGLGFWARETRVERERAFAGRRETKLENRRRVKERVYAVDYENALNIFLYYAELGGRT